MKTVSAALKAHLAGNLTTRAVCLQLTRVDGTIIAATLHDRDIVFNGVTYLAAAGGDTSNIEDSAALSVDNLSQRGILTSAAITEADLRAAQPPDVRPVGLSRRTGKLMTRSLPVSGSSST